MLFFCLFHRQVLVPALVHGKTKKQIPQIKRDLETKVFQLTKKTYTR